MKTILVSIISALALISCSSNKDLKTVADVDLEKYQGKWYEIARFPNSFEKGLVCVTANYKLLNNGKIEVINKGIKESDRNKIEESKGKAWVPNADDPSKIKVSFFWPFAGDYQIMALDANYNYALVGSPTLDYLWILSRTKSLDDQIIKQLKQEAAQQGFEVARLEFIEQNCDN